ncbi:hypothetical protein ZIOFF_020978 [Zingiber officinale]|uniref:Eukaryotic translation initiation factor 3 subunit K n=1 Tax=Zingiber officinale TaxID=94328 RepID=A0A8J5H910_ZINOF|nr:hypothetical protein ZIOFF_020978 [Zingiber officinale]
MAKCWHLLLSNSWLLGFDRAMGREPQQVSYTVEQLVSVNPYNPDILTELENYVNEQVSSQTYSLDANLCLLRLYQFDPTRLSIAIVVRILIKALMAMPAPDFSLCLFLIPEPVQADEQIKTLIVLSHYLETARFRQFWDEAAKNHSLLEVVPANVDGYIANHLGLVSIKEELNNVEMTVIQLSYGHFSGAGFEQAIQAYAIHVLSLSYQKVPRPVLAETINIEGLSLDKFIEYHVANSGWVLEKGTGRSQLIVLPRNEFNHPGLKKNSSDGMPFEHITRIFPVLS